MKSSKSKIREKMIEQLADLFVDDLIYLLESQGETAFRNTAKHFGLTEKEIEKNLKIWRCQK